jgi:hypothetical protein
MPIVGWCQENGLAYQSLVNEISAGEMRTQRNKSNLMPVPRDAPVSQIAPLGRTQSERRRRLALASGFRLLRLSGIDRLDEPVHGAGRGSAGPDG